MVSVANILLVAVPYDSGHHRLRMGGGPEHLLEGGLTEALEAAGREGCPPVPDLCVPR